MSVYNVSVDVVVPVAVYQDREVIHEFADAQNFEQMGRTDSGMQFQVTYGVVAPTTMEAYRRACNLVEAKLLVADIRQGGVMAGEVFGPDRDDGAEVLTDGE